MYHYRLTLKYFQSMIIMGTMIDSSRLVHGSLFFWIDGSWVYSMKILKWECRWLLENNGTEHNQEREVTWMFTHSLVTSRCCSCVSGSLTCGILTIYSEVAIVWLHITWSLTIWVLVVDIDYSRFTLRVRVHL